MNKITLLIMSLLIFVGCSDNQIKSKLSSHPAHHLENGFQNLYVSPPPKSFFSFLRMRFFSDVKWAKHDDRSNEVPFKKLDLARVNNPSNNLQISWLGHSTFLIQFKGLNIITDPVFSDRASPFSFVGPKRYIGHTVSYKLLPKIDFVVISHNHYDHLDSAAIKLLGNNPTYLVPLKLKPLFINLGIKSGQIKELDWWEKLEFPGLKIQAMPSQHWSARSLFDRNETLWASWFMQIANKKIWFAGDTGYNSIQFREIGKKINGVDLALIPIGGYQPRYFMSSYHVNPAEAVNIHHDLNAKVSIGMHWGTFPMTAEGPSDPVKELERQIKIRGIPKNAFRVMKVGETLNINN